MLTEDIRQTIRRSFEEELADGNRNVYFSQFYSSKPLSESTVREIFTECLDYPNSSVISKSENLIRVEFRGSYVFIWPVSDERWLFVYSTELNRRLRDKLDELSHKVGWLLDYWIPGEVVDDLFHEYSPGSESVNIERRWDPYYIYQRGGEIPDELRRYYNENYENFVEQEIEFSLKTPKSLVDKTLKEGVRDELLEKSEISESKFTFQQNSATVAGDGGTQVSMGDQQSRVTVRQRGVVVHSTGNEHATFDLLDEVDSRADYLDKFESAIPSSKYEQRQDGSLELTSYQSGKILRFEFAEKPYDQAASLTLQNLLTVGHSDVDIHGAVEYRNELDFYLRSYTSYDNGEYEILFTQSDHRPVLYIRPVAGEVSGISYIYHKLREKFDPRINVSEVDDFPSLEGM